MNALMSTQEVAKLLGVSPQTVRAWVKQNKIKPHIHQGNRIYFSRPYLEAWLLGQDAQEEKPRNAAKLMMV